jgi:hypothetical protein
MFVPWFSPLNLVGKMSMHVHMMKLALCTVVTLHAWLPNHARAIGWPQSLADTIYQATIQRCTLLFIHSSVGLEWPFSDTIGLLWSLITAVACCEATDLHLIWLDMFVAWFQRLIRSVKFQGMCTWWNWLYAQWSRYTRDFQTMLASLDGPKIRQIQYTMQLSEDAYNLLFIAVSVY